MYKIPRQNLSFDHKMEQQRHTYNRCFLCSITKLVENVSKLLHIEYNNDATKSNESVSGITRKNSQIKNYNKEFTNESVSGITRKNSRSRRQK